MANFSLIAEPPLAGVDLTYNGTHLRAPPDMAIVSLALPLGGEKTALAEIKKAYGVDLPEVGMSALTNSHTARLLRLSADLTFILFNHTEPNAIHIVGDLLNETSYLTDQTDVWSVLELSGPLSRTALERICPINLNPDVFVVNECARTIMEHLGTLVLHTDHDTYLLLSASSSAGSFLHAIETSLTNVA